MSLNHFSTGTDLQGAPTPWWPHQQQPTQTNHNSPSNHHHHQQFSPCPSHHLYQQQHQQQISSMFSSHTHPAFTFNLNQEDPNDDQESVLDAQTALSMEQQQQAEAGEVEKEPMFEKPLTPSDVGKLNRLVIPKQHAEKYFPLGGADSGDKGLLLSFEDESGKCWRFRYSYWNSSQSYVLTKGWSRYVKEKRLDAGDIILFERHRTDTERLFIGWRRRGASTTVVVQDSHSGGGGGGLSRGLYSGTGQPYPAHAYGVTVPHHAGSMGQNQEAAAPVGNLRTLRLFGVNMECQLDESEPSTPDGSSLSSRQGQAHTQHLQQFNCSEACSSNRHNHMDVNHMMRNRQG